MGVDFLQRIGRTLKRSWDEGRVRMATPDLMTRELVGGSRGMAADLVNGAKLSTGDAVTLELDGASIVARRGMNVVARNPSPSPGAVEAITRHHNILPGTVNTVHDVAGMVEITLSC